MNEELAGSYKTQRVDTQSQTSAPAPDTPPLTKINLVSRCCLRRTLCQSHRWALKTSFPRECVSKTILLIFLRRISKFCQKIFFQVLTIEPRVTRRRGATAILTGDDYRSKLAEEIAVREEKAKKKQKKGNPPPPTPPPSPPRPKAPARKSLRVQAHT